MSFATELKKVAKEENDNAIHTMKVEWMPGKPELVTVGVYTMALFTKCRKEAIKPDPVTGIEEVSNDRLMAAVIYYMCRLKKDGGYLFADVNEAVSILSSLDTSKVLELFSFAQGENPLEVGKEKE